MNNLKYGDYANFLKTIGQNPKKMGEFDTVQQKIVECDLDETPTMLSGQKYEIIYKDEGKTFIHCLRVDLRQKICDFCTIHGVNEDGSLKYCIHEHYFNEFMNWIKVNDFNEWKNICSFIIKYDIFKLENQIRSKENRLNILNNFPSADYVGDVDINTILK